MISKDEAQNLIHQLFIAEQETFIINTCELTPNKDYWEIHGHIKNVDSIGVIGHLVNTQTGQIETITTCHASIKEYLQDKYNQQDANGNEYVLIPSFLKRDKESLINLKQWLQCSYADAIHLVSLNTNQWLTGNKRYLQFAQAMLKEEGIETNIVLMSQTEQSQIIDRTDWFAKDIQEHILEYLKVTKNNQ